MIQWSVDVLRYVSLDELPSFISLKRQFSNRQLTGKNSTKTRTDQQKIDGLPHVVLVQFDKCPDEGVGLRAFLFVAKHILRRKVSCIEVDPPIKNDIPSVLDRRFEKVDDRGR